MPLTWNDFYEIQTDSYKDDYNLEEWRRAIIFKFFWITSFKNRENFCDFEGISKHPSCTY